MVKVALSRGCFKYFRKLIPQVHSYTKSQLLGKKSSLGLAFTVTLAGIFHGLRKYTTLPVPCIVCNIPHQRFLEAVF